MGSVINIWGRKLLICDCDEFTKEYYKSKYGIGKLTQIHLDWFYLTNYIILKLVELLYKELKLNKTPFTGCTLHSLPIQMQNISLWILGMCRKKNFEIKKIRLGLKNNDATVFFSSPLFFCFSCFLFFSFAGHLVASLHFGGNEGS